MKINFFEDTDTALIEFTSKPVVQFNWKRGWHWRGGDGHVIASRDSTRLSEGIASTVEHGAVRQRRLDPADAGGRDAGAVESHGLELGEFRQLLQFRVADPGVGEVEPGQIGQALQVDQSGAGHPGVLNAQELELLQRLEMLQTGIGDFRSVEKQFLEVGEVAQAGQAFIGDFVGRVELGQSGEALQVAKPFGRGPDRHNQRPKPVQTTQEGEVVVGQIGPVEVEQGDAAFPVRLNLRAPGRQPIGKPGRSAECGIGRLAGGFGLTAGHGDKECYANEATAE